ncbi:transcription-repair-coupling factor [Skermanella aerolata]|uniref:Transcription-repair-coupling factor n=1 Tax=Skermanella aerolata TaxID=393310 RepID=A0A512DQJ6_9PROT|nr:DEAD/DEAH box helicase [Skermanella aerolata]KJB95367.1 transcription-repair coupling factor [Skermanella aerolata KACC 11604]GEO38751.1 transcription-repair-coupling factor [Skermanella aerolata]
MDRNLDRLVPGRRIVAGAPEGYDAVLLARFAEKAGTSGLLHIVRDHRRLVRVRRALAFFAPALEVIPLVTWDCAPYDRRSPSAAVSALRIDTLLKLGRPAARPRLVLTTAHAFLRRLPPQGMLETSAFSAVIGDDIEEALRHFLLRNGYSPADSINAPGDFIWDDDRIDVFVPGGAGKLRLDLLNGTLNAVRRSDEDEELERLDLPPMSEVVLNDLSMRQFQTGYQERFGKVEGHDPLFEAVAQGRRMTGMEHWLPLFYGSTETLCEYLPGCPVTLDEGAEVERDDYLDQIADAFKTRNAMGSIEEKAKLPVFWPLPPEQVFIDAAAWNACLEPRSVTEFRAAPPESEPATGAVDGGARPGPRFHGTDGAEALKAHLDSLRGAGTRVLFAVERDAMHRPMKRRLGDPDLRSAGTWAEAETADDSWAIATLPVEAGFEAPGFHVIARADIVKPDSGKRRKAAAEAAGDLQEVAAIALGDLVVHAEHGVALCEGLEAVDAAGAPHDCVRLIYQKGDRLFVPVENMDLLWRFGTPGETVQLDKLGGTAWPKRLERVREAMREAAGELISTAARREMAEVEPIVPPRASYRRFSARFPYTETDDQQSAIDDVLADLASGKLMDRLVVGDVGFGKTEVALRAAFAVASSGRQVAVVAPTTPLARQHTDEFRERFAGFGYEVAMLSRLTGTDDAKEARSRIADGKARIVIGTQALLSQSVTFKDLGLLVLDEEQRMGVKQKERLKEIADGVHVLTMTATPIPRTLQLALAGLRDLSLIGTAPVERQPVRTRVLTYDGEVVVQALRRERERGGQSFYVCPRLADLDLVAERLEALSPELRIIRAHGKMPGDDLDDAITAFTRGGGDVLLATNIIEAGLNIPNANTLIVHRADMFGLSQLHQLRGRVGRADSRAYALLTVEPGHELSDTARRRLDAMAALTGPGSGFNVASQDMDIRGSGNLLGEEQSGSLRAVGADLFQDMLRQAIEAIKAGREPEEPWTPRITLGIPVLIGDRYVQDLDERMALYRSIAAINTKDAAKAFASRLAERHGPVPSAVMTLLGLGELKRLCREAGVEQIDVGPRGALISFRHEPEGVEAFLKRQAKARLRDDGRLAVSLEEAAAGDRVEVARTILEGLLSGTEAPVPA